MNFDDEYRKTIEQIEKEEAEEKERARKFRRSAAKFLGKLVLVFLPSVITVAIALAIYDANHPTVHIPTMTQTNLNTVSVNVITMSHAPIKDSTTGETLYIWSAQVEVKNGSYEVYNVSIRYGFGRLIDEVDYKSMEAPETRYVENTGPLSYNATYSFTATQVTKYSSCYLDYNSVVYDWR